MDFTQLAITGLVTVAMLIVALLAVVPTLSELPGGHRRPGRRARALKPHPAKVDQHSLPR